MDICSRQDKQLTKYTKDILKGHTTGYFKSYCSIPSRATTMSLLTKMISVPSNTPSQSTCRHLKIYLRKVIHHIEQFIGFLFSFLTVRDWILCCRSETFSIKGMTKFITSYYARIHVCASFSLPWLTFDYTVNRGNGLQQIIIHIEVSPLWRIFKRPTFKGVLYHYKLTEEQSAHCDGLPISNNSANFHNALRETETNFCLKRGESIKNNKYKCIVKYWNATKTKKTQ